MRTFNSPVSNTPVHAAFTEPLLHAFAHATSHRSCPTLPDDLWLEAGIRRLLSLEKSGRGFLQSLSDSMDQHIADSTFFDSLKSGRRLRMLREVSASVAALVAKRIPADFDIFKTASSLNDYDIYAGDGHYIEHACHDEKIDGTRFASGDLFGLNLRSHALFHITHALRGGTRKREHDVHALKRQEIATLRQQAPTGKKVIWVWDRAGIDAHLWIKYKQNNGIYFLSRAKENMPLEVSGTLDYDTKDPLNAGVTSFTLVSIASHIFRCVRYTCPDTGVAYTFITTLTQIEPGVIAALFRARWDIEKTFDEIKRKIQETKSWASGETAKNIHAEMRVLMHNLLLLLEHKIESEDQITNETENKRREKRAQGSEEKTKNANAAVSSILARMFRRVTQRTLPFIRWLRNNLDRSEPWAALLRRLKRIFGMPLE